MAQLYGAVLILLLSVSTVLSQQSATPSPATDPCTAAQQKTVGFLGGRVGSHLAGQKAGETDHGTNSIRRILDGCVVQETFSGGDSMRLRGASVSIFDLTTGKWKQTWVDNEGGYLDFVGELKGGQMILQREAVRSDGTKVLQRMVFKNISPNELDWSWEASRDGGRTWQIQWPIHYKRKG